MTTKLTPSVPELQQMQQKAYEEVLRWRKAKEVAMSDAQHENESQASFYRNRATHAARLEKQWQSQMRRYKKQLQRLGVSIHEEKAST